MKEKLEAKGAKVVITREKDDIQISNKERAEKFNDEKVDFAIRLFCNTSSDATKQGAYAEIPSGHIEQEKCKKAAEVIMSEFCKATGATQCNNVEKDNSTCFNWCKSPIITVEMGYLSNEEEDRNLNDEEYCKKIVRGLNNGIIKYFAEVNQPSGGQ